MRRWLIIATVLLGGPMAGRAQVYLQVVTSGPQTFNLRQTNNLIWASFVGDTGIAKPEPIVRRSSKFVHEILSINVRNMATNAEQVVVEWYFFAQAAKGKDKPHLAGVGAQRLALELGNGTNLLVSSPKLEQVEDVMVLTMPAFSANGRDYPARKEINKSVTGLKNAGYVVRVLLDGKPIAVQASAPQLKDQCPKPTSGTGVPPKR
jgi:hypothetical protein